MITLYHHPRTRSSRFIFVVEELVAPYAIETHFADPDGKIFLLVQQAG
jgi:hypothetical protein